MAEGDNTRLLITIEAQSKKLQNQLAQVNKMIDRSALAAEKRFAAMQTKSDASLAKAAKSAGNSLQTANIAAQFQDIAVQLQGGQSPFQIALQQGTQLTAALGSERGLKGALGALTAGFASMVNPISLATIAAITLGGVAVQWLGTVIPQTETASEAIARHAKALDDVVKGYEGAKAAAGDFTASLERLPKSAAALQITKQFDEMRKEAEKVRAEAGQLGQALANSVGTEAERRVGQLAVRFADGSLSAEEFYVELQKIQASDLGIFRFALDGVIDQLSEGALKAAAFGSAIDQVVASSHLLAGVAQSQDLADFFDNNSLDKTVESLKALTPELRTQAQIVEDTYASAIANPAITEAGRAELEVLRDKALAAQAELEARTKAASAAKAASAEAQREREAVATLIADLEHEYSLLGMTAQQKAVVNALRQAGAAATEEERQRIVELINAIVGEEEALRVTSEQMRFFADAGRSALQGYLTDVLNGTDATKALGNALSDIGNRLLGLGLDSIFGSGGGTGLLGQIFPHAKGGIAANGRPRAIPTFARGGISDSAAIFGETGQPEAAVPLPDGRRIPVDLRMPKSSGSGSPVNITYAPVIDARGADPAAITRLSGELAKMKAELPSTVVGAVRRARSTGNL